MFCGLISTSRVLVSSKAYPYASTFGGIYSLLVMLVWSSASNHWWLHFLRCSEYLFLEQPPLSLPGGMSQWPLTKPQAKWEVMTYIWFTNHRQGKIINSGNWEKYIAITLRDKGYQQQLDTCIFHCFLATVFLEILIFKLSQRAGLDLINIHVHVGRLISDYVNTQPLNFLPSLLPLISWIFISDFMT